MKLAKLRTEISNLEKQNREEPENQQPSSSMVLCPVLVFLSQRRWHTKGHLVLQLIEAHWDAMLDSLVACRGGNHTHYNVFL